MQIWGHAHSDNVRQAAALHKSRELRQVARGRGAVGQLGDVGIRGCLVLALDLLRLHVVKGLHRA